jgi:hypothetical protein
VNTHSLTQGQNGHSQQEQVRLQSGRLDFWVREFFWLHRVFGLDWELNMLGMIYSYTLILFISL